MWHRSRKLLYTIYTNEFPLLQNVMEDQEIWNIIGAKYHEKLPADHVLVNFVDNSNSVISTNPGEDMEGYINDYFQLLYIYYISQKLKINNDKTQLSVCSMPKRTMEINTKSIQPVQLFASFSTLHTSTEKSCEVHIWSEY